ncbi:MAG: hypothetical protein VX408_04180 [Pseudomonadota bacterium]|nr:hypothetical protein [Pseudomonadota bacterium]MED6318284.1 hypothetical protein [Pseudomonadota bacterium]
MSALILKSGNALNAGFDSIEFTTYKNRVLADGGIIADEVAVKEAMAWANENGVSSSVFSATSPRWGVKLLDGKLKKMYSLYDESGDIDVIIGNSTAIEYNTTAYTFPTLRLGGSSANILKSKDVIASHINSVLCNISITPTITGNGLGFTKSAILDLTANDSSIKRIHSISQSRPTSSASATELYPTANGYGTSGQVVASTVKNAATWSSVASFLDGSHLSVYAQGLQIGQDTTITPNAYNSNLSYNIGSNREPGSETLAYTSPFLGYIAESWCLINTDETKAQILSTRAEQLYAS